MAVASSKTSPYKWYIFHRNHVTSVYLLAIYLTVTVLVLHDFQPVFYLIPAMMTIGLVRLAWDQTNHVLSALALFLIGLACASFLASAVRTRQQRSLQLLYNYEQFKNISSLNPKIEKQSLFPPVFNIFFVETNMNREQFSTKQLCAIESAAKNNRNFRVQVLSIRSQLVDRQLQSLVDFYPNIVLMKFMPIELFRDTPLAAWWQSGRVFKSPYMLAHISDAARLALLWKYGGVYSDLDTITIKSFQSLLDNGGRGGGGVGYLYENADSVGNGVLVFAPAHRFIARVMDAFAAGYDPYVWGANGPTTFLNMLKTHCNVNNVLELMSNTEYFSKSNNNNTSVSYNNNNNPCDVTVFPEKFFYPFRYIDDEYRVLFEKNGGKFVDAASKLTSAYSVHYYGFKSKDLKVSTRETTFFGFLAACNCELTYRHLDSNRLLFE